MLNKATLIDVTIDRLVCSPSNPRKERKPEAIAEMKASIKANGGTAHPFLVHNLDDGRLGVLDGETRRQGSEALIADGTLAADNTFKALLLPDGLSEDKLRAIALACNVIRDDMNPIEIYEQFVELAKTMKLKQIATMFGMTVRQVQQHLALGNLIEPARNLVRRGLRTVAWAEAMTMASEAMQTRVCDLIGNHPHSFENAIEVRQEVARKQIRAEYALFDPVDLKDCLVGDLFSDEGDYFTDPEAFWKKQNEAIEARKADLQATHALVTVMRGERFDRTGWIETDSPKNATAVIVVDIDGRVDIYENLLPPAAINGAGAAVDIDDSDVTNEMGLNETSRPASDASAPADAKAPRPATIETASSKTRSYLNAQNTASLRADVVGNVKAAKALLIASTLTSFRGAPTLRRLTISLDAKDQRSAAFGRLTTKRSARDSILQRVGVTSLASVAEVSAKLMTLSDGELDEILAFSVAEGLDAPVTDESAALAEALGTAPFTGWKIEQPYLSTLGTPEVRQLARELVGGMTVENAKRTDLERMILDQVAADAKIAPGHGASGWLPREVASVIARDSLDLSNDALGSDPLMAPAANDDGDAAIAA